MTAKPARVDRTINPAAFAVFGRRKIDIPCLVRYAHDATAYTQGLAFSRDGRLFESVGGYGTSAIRELDPTDWSVRRQRAFDASTFLEGISAVDEVLIALTWREGVAYVLRQSDFATVHEVRYRGEGWGLCASGGALLMTDGASTIRVVKSHSLEIKETLGVTDGGAPLEGLNDVAANDDFVICNVNHFDHLVIARRSDGKVVGRIDTVDLLSPRERERLHPRATLNGVASSDGLATVVVTGKHWPCGFKLDLAEFWRLL